VDIERHVPELYVVHDGAVHESIMDLVAWWPASGKHFMIDVTVRSPFARGLSDPSRKPGVAAAAGERDKVVRYGPAVLPFAVEQFGRLGAVARQTLAALHRESCDYGRPQPGSGRAVALSLRALWADIEAAVVQTVAQTTLLALGASALPALGWIASERGRAERPAGGEPPGGGGGARRAWQRWGASRSWRARTLRAPE